MFLTKSAENQMIFFENERSQARTLRVSFRETARIFGAFGVFDLGCYWLRSQGISHRTPSIFSYINIATSRDERARPLTALYLPTHTTCSYATHRRRIFYYSTTRACFFVIHTRGPLSPHTATHTVLHTPQELHVRPLHGVIPGRTTRLSFCPRRFFSAQQTATDLHLGKFHVKRTDRRLVYSLRIRPLFKFI